LGHPVGLTKTAYKILNCQKKLYAKPKEKRMGWRGGKIIKDYRQPDGD